MWWWIAAYTGIIFCIVFLVVLVVPTSEYPDEIETPDGKMEKLDDKKKMAIKSTLILLVALFGWLITWWFYYIHKKSKLWS